MKSLKDISWLISEEEYRKDSALSYSTLARFEREGFNNIDKLFDRIETPSLTFGSAVDAYITGGEDEFLDNFFQADFPELSDANITIVKTLFKNCSSKYTNLNDIPNEIIIDCTNFYKYQLNWKPETRAKVIKEKGSEYYRLLWLAKNKTILNTKEYQDVMNSVRALKDSDATKFYFAPNNPFDNIERFYQLKFKATLEGIDYRCMADLIIVDHDNKTIQPVDLKTSSHTEWDFFKSFIDWRYDIQARLYWRIIRYVTSLDDTYKDYTVLPYKFIVVNKRTLTPLVWDFNQTQQEGILVMGKSNNIVLRDPEDIGRDLKYYLDNKPKVPKMINIDKGNNLVYWINCNL